MFHRISRLLTGINQPDKIVRGRLSSGRYVRTALPNREREINLGGLWFIERFKQRSWTLKKVAQAQVLIRLDASSLIRSMLSLRAAAAHSPVSFMWACQLRWCPLPTYYMRSVAMSAALGLRQITHLPFFPFGFSREWLFSLSASSKPIFPRCFPKAKARAQNIIREVYFSNQLRRSRSHEPKQVNS